VGIEFSIPVANMKEGAMAVLLKGNLWADSRKGGTLTRDRKIGSAEKKLSVFAIRP
jgi:hypothetical protein